MIAAVWNAIEIGRVYVQIEKTHPTNCYLRKVVAFGQSPMIPSARRRDSTVLLGNIWTRAEDTSPRHQRLNNAEQNSNIMSIRLTHWQLPNSRTECNQSTAWRCTQYSNMWGLCNSDRSVLKSTARTVQCFNSAIAFTRNRFTLSICIIIWIRHNLIGISRLVKIIIFQTVHLIHQKYWIAQDSWRSYNSNEEKPFHSTVNHGSSAMRIDSGQLAMMEARVMVAHWLLKQHIMLKMSERGRKLRERRIT